MARPMGRTAAGDLALTPSEGRVAPTGRPLLGYLETMRRIDVRPDSIQVLGETLSHRGCPPVSGVWLSSGLRSRRAPREERLERGLFCSK
jgi:hypothetical protein